MGRFRIVVVIVLSVVAVASPTAGANIRHRSDPVVLAFSDAYRFWGRLPCNGDVRVVIDLPPAGRDDPGIAWSSADNLFVEPDGSYDPIAAAALTGSYE